MPNIIEVWSPNVTLEGDTMVMYQQTAKGIIKTFRLVKDHGKTIKGIYKYLNEYNEYIGSKDHTTSFKTPFDLLKLLKVATLQCIYHVNSLLPEIDDEINYDIAWNKTYQIDIISASLLNAHYLVSSMFLEEIVNKELPQAMNRVFYQMLTVYLSDVILKYGQQLLLDNYITGNQLLEIKANMDVLISDLRPHVFTLTESYLPHPSILHSVLGLSNGKVYEKMYEVSSGSPINKKDKLDAFDETILPLRKKMLSTAKL